MNVNLPGFLRDGGLMIHFEVFKCTKYNGFSLRAMGINQDEWNVKDWDAYNIFYDRRKRQGLVFV